MLVLQSGTNTKRDLTLKEKSSIGSYVWIIFFVADHEQKQFGCLLTDLSAYPDRYNRFTIKVQANPNPSAGEVDLYKPGFYHYYAYEINNISTFNFNWVGSLKFENLQSYLVQNHSFTGQVVQVEKGKMKYLSADETIPNYADGVAAVNSYD